MTTITNIIITIAQRDEKASHRFQRAKYFKVRAIQTQAEAIVSEDWEGIEFAHRFNDAYKRNMRLTCERIAWLTGIDEAEVKAVMAEYAKEVVTDALVDCFPC